MSLNFSLPYTLHEKQFSEWGPPTHSPESVSFTLGSMEDYPFEPTTKQERLGRVCDFTYATFQRSQRDGRPLILGNDDETDFKLVDSRPIKANKFQNRYIRRHLTNRRLGLQQQQQQHQINQSSRGGQQGNQAQTQRQYQQQNAQRQMQWQRNNRQRQLAEWSVEPQQDWTFIDVRPLSILPRTSINSCQIEYEDIEWRGELRVYDRAMDRILPKSPVSLVDSYTQTLSFYWPGTGDDAFLVSTFEKDMSISVAATDQILACLMSASQSRISWHLLFNKVNDRLFIDKSNGTSVDLITVDETSKEPPLLDDPIRINRPGELAVEALKINQNFSQQVLHKDSSALRSYPQPSFVDSNDIPAPKLYRYRLIKLPGQPNSPNPLSRKPVTIVTRGEIDCVMPGTTDSYVTVRAFNEYNLLRTGRSWKAQLESQKGALIAQETKNNHCKVGKWVAQALIAGCDYLKIGFVTRVAYDNNTRHNILNIQTYKTRELGAQTGLQEDTAWGIVRGIIDLVMSQPDGRYTLVKDPVKPEIKLYRTFLATSQGEHVNMENSLEEQHLVTNTIISEKSNEEGSNLSHGNQANI